MRALTLALLITLLFLIIEVIGGVLTRSLALVADAGHMATDAAAIGLSLFAAWLSSRPATPQRSFGYYRVEVLAALVNAAALICVSVLIFWEAFRRFAAPPEVDSGPMLVVALAGLAANGLTAWILRRGHADHENLNVRGAFLHVIGDMLSSAGAIVAAVVMLATGWYLADPILSAVIGLLILYSAWRLLWNSINVLMEATPSSIVSNEVRQTITAVEGVEGIHDLHIWTVTPGLIALSSHVEVSGQRDWHKILLELSDLLRRKYGIGHVTLQPEQPARLPDRFRGCSLDSPEGRATCLTAVQTGAPDGDRHP